VSAINFAKIHELVFEIPCLQTLITHRYRRTDRHNRVHDQPPLYGWWLIMICFIRRYISLLQQYFYWRTR